MISVYDVGPSGYIGDFMPPLASTPKSLRSFVLILVPQVVPTQLLGHHWQRWQTDFEGQGENFGKLLLKAG